MSIEINLSAALAERLKGARQQWDDNLVGPLQYALFAGQKMTLKPASEGESGTVELHFLGFVGSGFESVDQAKDSAAAFAKEVFGYLDQMVSEE